MKFIQATQVGSNVTDIMRLPCVRGTFKYPVNTPYNMFPLRGHEPKRDDIIYCVSVGKSCNDYALTGDWICQDERGVWMVLSDDEYKKEVEP